MDELNVIHRERDRLILRQGGLWWPVLMGGLLLIFALLMMWASGSATRLTCTRSAGIPMQCQTTHEFLGLPYATENLGPLRGARLAHNQVGWRTTTSILLIAAADTQVRGPEAAATCDEKGEIVNAINTFVQSPQETRLEVPLDGDSGAPAAILLGLLGLLAGIGGGLARNHLLTRWTFDRTHNRVLHRYSAGLQVKAASYALRDIANAHVAVQNTPQGEPTYRVELVTYDRRSIPLLAWYSNRASGKERAALAIREFLQQST
ncbi:MAG TPA: hypothetical protein PKH77_07525 [Anaerolineae bacterium]|nr:hypothetical protein [Anaerolineae bacterium]